MLRVAFEAAQQVAEAILREQSDIFGEHAKEAAGKEIGNSAGFVTGGFEGSGQLSEVTEVPLPDDPGSGRPFAYQREGDTGILTSPQLTGTPPASGCDRSSFDDVFDYNGYGGANGIPVCTVDGTPGPSGYTVQVTVTAGAGAILTGGIPAADTCQITVTVRQGPNIYQLIGWRTNFGG